MAEAEYARMGVEGRESNVVVEKGGNETARNYSDLPLDIAAEIARRLILVDYLHMRAACRMFRSISPPLDWKNTLNAAPKFPSLSPWLIFFEKDGVCSLVDPRYGDKYLINLPPSLSSCEIRYSKNGWLLMSGSKASRFFFNPFTRKILPFLIQENPRGISPSYVGFSCDPTSSDCLIVGVKKFRQQDYSTFASLGNQRWVSCIRDETDFLFHDNSPVFYHGASYCLGQGGNLGVIEFRNRGAINWKVLPKPERPCSSYLQNFLVECNGELLAVFVGEFGKEVRVFRLNRLTMAWMEVESLGNYMIYISRSSSLATMATTPGMENKIYFPRFCGQSGYSIVFYSLDTKKFHSFESKDSEVEFYSTREQLCAGWIQPNWC